ncbi:MAG: OmpA family protein [Deltaproteobacteria bacterium]|nr:OmpA family protein [Deltaproteobacteria bacterium]
MRNRHLILLLSILLATFLVAGCGSARQVTKGETDQFNAISGKIAEAEGMTPKGAKVCAPKELAIAKAELDGVRHQANESWDDTTKTGLWSDSSIDKASKAADAVLAKTKACQPPVLNYSAAPETISPGQCSTLTWSSQNVQKAEIDQEVGAVAASGSKQVCPKETTQYMLTATGTGGTVYETATVTVKAPTPPPPPPPVAAPVVAPAAAPKAAEEVTLRVNFDTNKYTIRPVDLAELQKAVDFAKKNPDAKFHLVGYTDSRGNAKKNQKLSENRAESVKKYLVGEAIAPEKITSEGKGAADPVGDNKTKEGQFLNRRVVLKVISK